MPAFPAIPKAVTRQHYAQHKNGAAKFALYALIDSVDVSLEVSADSLPAFKINLAAWTKENHKAFRYSIVSFWLVLNGHDFKPYSPHKPPRF
jgi:hypothetical protein